MSRSFKVFAWARTYVTSTVEVNDESLTKLANDLKKSEILLTEEDVFPLVVQAFEAPVLCRRCRGIGVKGLRLVMDADWNFDDIEEIA